jgi:hypothetical protein
MRREEEYRALGDDWEEDVENGGTLEKLRPYATKDTKSAAGSLMIKLES